jgi:hypothetical protein
MEYELYSDFDRGLFLAPSAGALESLLHLFLRSGNRTVSCFIGILRIFHRHFNAVDGQVGEA